ncbi:MAG: hypothetical protein EOO04_19250 [Chitinophagaceae bacterium]|nr:MAG: hypothetical protein EOO04_19250 [Chitinophagaceae bacterium]
MKSSDSFNSRFASTVKDVKIFFSTCLSMHMLPVLFALVLIIAADQKSNSRIDDTASQTIVVTPNTGAAAITTGAHQIKNYVLLNPTNMTQVVAIYKTSRLIMKTIR